MVLLSAESTVFLFKLAFRQVLSLIESEAALLSFGRGANTPIVLNPLLARGTFYGNDYWVLMSVSDVQGQRRQGRRRLERAKGTQWRWSNEIPRMAPCWPMLITEASCRSLAIRAVTWQSQLLPCHKAHEHRVVLSRR